jgi:arginyl-tRNA synthetase
MPHIKSIVKRLLIKVSGLKGNDFVLDVPEKKVTSAHFYTNLAFVLGKRKKKSPAVSAKDIFEKLKKSKIFSSYEEKNGFLNFWVSDGLLKKELKKIITLGEKYGASRKNGKKIQIEYISANPTGPLTLANGRGGFWGDILSNIFSFSGWKVEREYYVNDVGNQILNLGKSALWRLNLASYEDGLYAGDYIKRWAFQNKLKIIKLKDPMKIGQLAASYFLSQIKETLEKMADIKFDRYTSENNIHQKGWVKKAIGIFEKSGFVFKKDGALWLKTSYFGDDKDRVLITKEGKPTYFLSDAGHYLETINRGFYYKINILGPDHYGYVKRIQAVSKIFGFKVSDVLITQAVLIKKDGELYKMSKRKGNFVTFEELLKNVGKDAARFFFVSQSLNSHIDFDLNLVKERSNKNPLFYLEYSYVRALKILQKSSQKPIFNFRKDKLSDLEKDLVFQLTLFPAVIEDICKTYEVDKLIRYAMELARNFHNFYEKEKVLGSEDESKKLSIVFALVIVLKNIFYLLNIEPPKEM